MASWSWVLCTHTGQPLPGAHIARGRRLVYQRNQEAEARLTFSLHDKAAVELFAALRNGIPQLRVYRNATLVFSGLWTPMNGANAAAQESYVNLVFKDAFHRLRHRLTAATVTYTAQDAGQIARQLIDATHTAHGDTTIATDTAWVQATKNRDRTYEHKNVGEAIVELTEVLDGFDWYPTYLDPRDNSGKTMRFNVAARQGQDRPGARFEYGEGTMFNCRGYTFTTGLPVNRTRAIGAESAGTPITSEKADAASVDRYSTYMQMVSATDVSQQATLDDKAQDALRPNIVQVTDFQPDPEKSPQPWDDFWIGDTVRWNVDDGAVQQQLAPRIHTIEVGLDDTDEIDDLNIGIDPDGTGHYLAPHNSARSYIQRQRAIERRLSALER